ncbi:hypothetical protein C5C18_10285 [Rathayibacter tritici]|uniref:hypothetical protein n=1 Tax=Rathayibacter tritici TaxID=33888 RepID=UPI000CE8DD60|nr:hypothetical protein [Rathayibacter tritici]PPF66979.1 hypothetical protein C5C21_07985 [Rathayibacter tritici]PPG06418.1 hypothetical protein C5C18_10285 [Rathayibacter tritici]
MNDQPAPENAHEGMREDGPRRGRWVGLVVGAVAAAVVLVGAGVLIGSTLDPGAGAAGAGGTASPAPTGRASTGPTTAAPQEAAPESIPASTPTPPDVPGPTPSTADGGVASWIIGFDGVGPLTLGAALPEATAALDATGLAPIEDGECPSDHRNLPGDGNAWIQVDADPSGSTVALVSVWDPAADGGVQAPGTLPATAEGITIGSSAAELRTAYPELTTWQTLSDEPGYAIDDDRGRRIWFRVDGASDVVQAVSVSQSDRFPVGGCGV